MRRRRRPAARSRALALGSYLQPHILPGARKCQLCSTSSVYAHTAVAGPGMREATRSGTASNTTIVTDASSSSPMRPLRFVRTRAAAAAATPKTILRLWRRRRLVWRARRLIGGIATHKVRGGLGNEVIKRRNVLRKLLVGRYLPKVRFPRCRSGQVRDLRGLLARLEELRLRPVPMTTRTRSSSPSATVLVVTRASRGTQREIMQQLRAALLRS